MYYDQQGSSELERNLIWIFHELSPENKLQCLTICRPEMKNTFFLQKIISEDEK